VNTSNPTETFLLEAEDLLDQIEAIALEAGQQPADGEAVNRLFRAFHTIKGSGSMFGFDVVAGFTHHVETALDQVRAGTVPVTPPLIGLILAARDQIKRLLEDSANDAPANSAESARIVAALNELVGATAATPGNPISSAPPVVPAAPAATTSWRIGFRPVPGIAASGLNPVLLLDELRGLGSCTVTARLDGVPALESLNAEECHLSWEIVLTTGRDVNAIKDVFIFVDGECELAIERIAERPLAVAPAGRAAACSTSGAIAAVDTPSRPALPLSPPLKSPEGAPRESGAGRKPQTKESSVRVPSARLDRLVNLVGELVMNQSRLTQVASLIDQPDLNVPVEELERLIGEVRDTVLGIRMMPIGTTFARFKRLVHDLSGELAKEIDLVTSGEETELDKTVLDRLGDPLVHLIRNSIDHGIESPDARVLAGKPRRGSLRLTAAHIGSSVVITVQDDGRGLDAQTLRAKAIERKLIAPDAVLSQRELFNLILLPGFSTAKQVTSVSGRGVGMDVVKREIDALGGSLQIASEPGRGTTISATLPLTLAIIDGLLVEIGSDQFIIPMSTVQENVELVPAERGRHNGRNAVAIRGELVPYVYLRETFAIGGAEPELEKIVIVRHGADRVGLVVDRVLGSHQTVIQSLGRFYRDIEVLSGATIMGDGRVALILDLAGLIRVADARAQAALAPRLVQTFSS